MTTPQPDNEPERLRWLQESRLLDTPREDAFDDITRLAAQICGVPIAAISLVDSERQWFKSIVGLPISETPRDVAFCAHTILQAGVMVVPDAALDDRFRDNPLVTGDPDIRFYAGAPLVTSDGHALGSLCVIDRSPRQLTEQQRAVLEVLARQVAGRIELQRSLALQERLIGERARAEEALRQSELRLRLALESGGLGTWHLDLATHQLEYVSPFWKSHFGLPPDAEVSLPHVFQAIHPDDRAAMRQALERAVASRGGMEAKHRVVWPDGSIHWISVSATTSSDAAGEPQSIIGMTQDITARVEAEEERERALHEAEERADRDPLTGLWNHRAFHARFSAEASRAEREGTALAVVMLDLNNFGFFNKACGHTIGDGVLRAVAERLQQVCRPYDTVARFGGDEFVLLLPGVGPATAAEIESRLLADLACISFQPSGTGAPIPVTVSLGASLFTDAGTDHLEVLRRADQRLLRSKTGGAADTEADQVRAAAGSVEGYSMLDALVAAVDNKDRYTRRHSEDVMAYSLLIACELGLDEKTRHTVAVAALLHDVGKIGVPDSILRKPGPLTGEESAAIQHHPTMGAALVSTVPGLESTLDAVRHHHERWGGGGYPSGLRGEETPLLARLMAVADAYSAMTTDRPYRKGMDRAKALSILSAGAGAQWDPTCVEAFLAALTKAEDVTGGSVR